MRSIFFFGRNPAAVLITILVVIFLGASYLYVYRPNNERRIKEQGFRAMQNIDGNIRAKIQNSVALLNNVLSAYASKSMDQDSINNYIKSISGEKFKVTQFDTLKEAETEKLFKTGDDSVSSIQVDNAARQFKINFSKKYARTKAYRIAMVISFEQFIKPLLPANLMFDQYLVFGNEQTVYQTFPSGLNRINADSLLGKKNTEGAKMITREISGTNYQLFLQQVSFTVGSNWIFAGLLSNEKYQYEKNQLPPNIVLLMITVALAIIISFPWIKLFHMGNQDRLMLFDGLLLAAVTMLLMSLLFFTLFKYNAKFRSNYSPDSKENIANAITTTFKKEIKRKYNALVALDRLCANNSFSRLNIVLGGKAGSHISDKRNSTSQLQKTVLFHSVDSIFQKAGFGKSDLNQVYWMNQRGKELFRWDSLQYNAPQANFNERDWFKNIISGKTYQDSLTTGSYYLDQLTSWTTGKFTTVISRKSDLSTADSTIVEAFAFDMKCFYKVILPAGYTFAMIDQNGKVLYHADTIRNLNENLLKEFSAHAELHSCMEARAQKVFQTAYLGRNYNVEVKPVNGLPYFIIIFSDTDFKDTRDMETYCFTLSMLVVFAGYLAIEMLAIFLVSSNRSVFKKQQLDTNWIGPKASFHQQYILSSILNICIILLLNFYFRQSTFAGFLFMLLFSSTSVLGFLICLYARRYQKEDNRILFQSKIRAVYTLLIFILLINLLAWKNLEHFRQFFSYEFITVLLGAVLFVFGDDWVKKGRQMAVRYSQISWDYSYSFALMVLTRLVISSGIPVALFYVMSYNYEQNLVIRFRHYDFGRRLMEKNPNANSAYLVNLKKDTTNAVYTDGSWINSIGYSRQKIPAEISKYNHEDSLTISMLNVFRFYKDSSAVRESNLYQSNATDLSFFYNPLFKEALYRQTGTTTYLATRKRGSYLMLRSNKLNYRLPMLFKKGEILFWVVMLLLLLVFYIMLLKIIRKLFALNVPATNIWKAIDKEVLLCNDLNKLVFIIGLPGSHKLFYILNKIENKELVQDNGQPYFYNPQLPDQNNILVLDLIEIPDNTDPASDDNIRWKNKQDDLFSKDYKLVLINHFEYNIKDETTSRIKLNMLERLMVQNKCKIIILSAIHPIAFLDSLNALAEINASKVVQDLERWHVLLGHYRIVIHPIERKAYNKGLPDWEEMIVKETQYTHFLIKMQNNAIKAASSLPKKEKTANGDALAFKLQVTAHYFYMYIWQSLTKEEKFLLYDLAEDGLVNSFDDYNLSMLISKGVIIRTDGTLMLFNRGFRNFILTAIGNTEALKIKSQMQDNGNWGKLKTPLLVVIFAILAFLLTSQQEAYSKLIAYVTALATGIPMVIKLFSLFGNNPAQKSS